MKRLLLLFSLLPATTLAMSLEDDVELKDRDAKNKVAVQRHSTVPSLFDLCKQELKVKGIPGTTEQEKKKNASLVLDLAIQNRADLGTTLLPAHVFPLPSCKIDPLIRAPGSPSDHQILILMGTSVQVRDAVTGALVHTLQHGNHTNIDSAAFNSNKDRIITGSNGSSLTGPFIWDAKTGALLKTLDYNRILHSVAFGATDDRIITGSFRTVEVWDTATEKVIHTFDSVITHNNRLLLNYGSSKGTVCIWDINTGEQLHTLNIAYSDQSCVNAAFNTKGTQLVTVNLDGTGHLWDVSTGKLIYALSHGYEYDFKSVTFNSDGTLIMTESYGSKIRIWDVSTGNLARTLPHVDRRHPLAEINFNKKGDQVISSYWGSSTCVWDIGTGKLLYTLPETTENQKCVFPVLTTMSDRAITTRESVGTCVWDLSQIKEFTQGDITKEQYMLLQLLEDEFVKHKYIRLAWIAQQEDVSVKELHAILDSFSPAAKQHIISAYTIKPDLPYELTQSKILLGVAATGLAAAVTYLGWKLFKR